MTMTETMSSTTAAAGQPKREAEFWDSLAEGYAAQPVRDPESYEHTLTRVRSYLSPFGRVLEVGCGTGTTALKLADAAGEILATDISGGMIDIARRKARAAGAANVRFETGEAGNTTGVGWNAVLAFNLLHLMRKPEDLIAHAYRTLEPGGVFISKTPCLGGWRKLLLGPVIAAMQWRGKAPYVRYLSVERLEEMIAAAGFEIVETGTFPKSPPARFVVARKT